MELEGDLLYKVADIVQPSDLLDLTPLARRGARGGSHGDRPSVGVLWVGPLAWEQEDRSVAVHNRALDRDALGAGMASGCQRR